MKTLHNLWWFQDFLCPKNSHSWKLWHEQTDGWRNGQSHSYVPTNIDLARNDNSGCANEILGCVKCHFWWKSPWKWKNWVILGCAISSIACAKHGCTGGWLILCPPNSPTPTPTTPLTWANDNDPLNCVIYDHKAGKCSLHSMLLWLAHMLVWNKNLQHIIKVCHC